MAGRVHEPTQPSKGRGCVWILTDHRYLGQRMPLALVRWLEDAGTPCRVVAVGGRPLAPASLLPGAHEDDLFPGLAPGDVVVPRTRDPLALSLLAAVDRPGVQVLLPSAAIHRVRDKARMACTLSQHGIPTPPTWLATAAGDLAQLPPTAFPLLCKPHLGDNARGIVAVAGPRDLDEVDCTDGIIVAQTFVDVGGVDLKLYGAGERVWAVRRPSPLPGTGGDAAAVTVVEVTPQLHELAGACRDAFGLDLFGVDVLEGPDGPLVVEVNEFPNYTGVPDAAEAIGRLVLDRLAPVVVS
jgi:ribosomal protein S6--L-glutamate ligase